MYIKGCFKHLANLILLCLTIVKYNISSGHQTFDISNIIQIPLVPIRFYYI